MNIKERIIENSMEMFLNRGCKSVTMDEIAIENGISKRTLYELFSDKSTLLEECILYTSKKMKCNIDSLMKETGNIFDMIVKIHENQAELSINMRINFFSELRKFYPEIYKKLIIRFSEFHNENITRFLQRGQDEGVILNNIDKAITSRMIMEISNIIGDKEIFSLENISRKQLFKETLLYYFRGISTEKGINMMDEYLKIN